MTQNHMFPLEVSNVQDSALVVKSSDTSIWHLNIKGVKLLGQRNMVVGLPKIDSLDFCEGCVYGKKRE